MVKNEMLPHQHFTGFLSLILDEVKIIDPFHLGTQTCFKVMAGEMKENRVHPKPQMDSFYEEKHKESNIFPSNKMGFSSGESGKLPPKF